MVYYKAQVAYTLIFSFLTVYTHYGNIMHASTYREYCFCHSFDKPTKSYFSPIS